MASDYTLRGSYAVSPGVNLRNFLHVLFTGFSGKGHVIIAAGLSPVIGFYRGQYTIINNDYGRAELKT
jgi:hypothetical protein